MELNKYILDNWAYVKIPFVLYYSFFVICIDDKLPLPMVYVFLISLLEVKTIAIGIIGLLSLLYLLVTSLGYFYKTWNYKLTIICTSILTAFTVLPIYYAILNHGILVYLFIIIAWLWEAFIIYGSILGLRELKIWNLTDKTYI